MNELQFFRDDGSKTLRELLLLRGRYRSDSIVMAIDDRLQRNSTDTYSQAELIILGVEELERRVNTGGFKSFFINEPQFAGQIVDFLELIQCINTAKIATKAISRLGSQDLTKLDDVVAKAVIADFESEDQEFLAYPDDIVEHLLTYIEKNQNSIRCDATPIKSSWLKKLFSRG